MADPRDIFRDSDTVRITQASFDLITPSVLPGGTITSMNVCVKKVPGELNLVLNTRNDFRLFFSQDIVLIADLPLPISPSQLTWNIDQTVDINFFPGTTLKRIKGSISALFQEIDPQPPGFACDNVTSRVVGASFQTTGTENELDLFVDTALLGDWKITNIQLLGGTAAKPVDIGTWDVSIRVRPPRESIGPCRVWARQGQAVWFDAVISNLPSGAAVTYEWSFPGGTSTDPSVLVALTRNVTITVTATVTLLGQTNTKSHSLSFTALSPDEADAIETVCRLRERLQEYLKISPLLPGSQNKVRGFVDPLWDEVPFFRTDGIAVSEGSLRELAAATERLRIESASLATSLGTALSQERETTAESKSRATSG